MIKRVIPQMFDVRPLDENGNLDLEKMERVEKKMEAPALEIPRRKAVRNIQRASADILSSKIDPWRFSNPARKEEVLPESQAEFVSKAGVLPELPKKSSENENYFSPDKGFHEERKKARIVETEHPNFSFSSVAHAPIVPEEVEQHCAFWESENEETRKKPLREFTSYIPPVEKVKNQKVKEPSLFSRITGSLKDLKSESAYDFGTWRPAFSFVKAAMVVFLFFFGTAYVYKGLSVKNSAENSGQMALAELVQAKEGIQEKNFDKSSFEFGEAYDRFDEISKDVDSLGAVVVEASRFVPYVSKLSSGKYLAQAGKDISQIGGLSSEVLKTLERIKNPLNASASEEQVSFLKIFQDTNKSLKEVSVLAKSLEENLGKVNVEDIPEDKRKIFADLRQKLPEVNDFADGFLGSSEIFTDILGGNGPRKYLFLFQNNNEMRATGGFIGTYGVLDIFNGRIRKFYVDGIFNPDGQLTVDVVPPTPIQKISGGWSLHDSNWFPDFPKSAEKAIWFFGKTGGPTVDGVITMTPEVMKDLLGITGPIEMVDYGITIDKDNFVEEVQEEVENDYDKELNQPKKILSDLAPLILDKIFNVRNVSDIAKTMGVLENSLNEKHILLYSSNYKIEKDISERGWSGEILSTQKDYLGVINSNINGFKTDGVVDEKIEHLAEIQKDGSIVDTVTITRKHNGGNYEYEWFNKVNADYMRVYVPLGSKLISAEGQSREFNSSPLDYDKLKFKRDPQVQMEENSANIDEDTGTRIYEDSGKTVFANWVYVSPQETTVVKYKYLLPYSIKLDSENKLVDTYSLLVQKQSGSRGSAFDSEVIFPENYKVVWKYPDGSLTAGSGLQFSGDLKKDKFIGIAFQNK